MPKTEQLKAQLAELGQAFRKRLEQELPELVRQAEQLQNTEQVEPALQQLQGQLHKLAGSAGTFGHTALGERARELEQLAKHCLADPAAADEARKRLREGLCQLPLLLNQSRPEPQDSQPLESALPDEQGQQHILMLEHDPELARQTSQTLSNFGYQVTILEQADSLITQLDSGQYAALIIDISPEVAGHQALGALQRWQAGRVPPLPVIAISTDSAFAARLEAVRAGARGFFTKPVDLTVLENRLRRSFEVQQDDPFRVLVVDDDQELAERFKAILDNAGMRVETVLDPAQLIKRMNAFQPDVVLMDINMPHYSGIELAQMIRLNDNWLRVPIIYLSAETDTVAQMAALLKAGDDFVSKPISDAALLTTVYARAQRARLVSQALARDSMTGLLKHADIKEQVELEVERALRTQQPVSIAMIDIDHFKSVNDNHGHAVGDTVIRALANLLRQRLRRIDRIGRYGGEEFVAVLPNCAAADAKAILDSIREAFSALQFSSGSKLFQCTFSAGISACEAPDWCLDEPLELADQHLYQAKQQGRNRVIGVSLS
ncbi:diguanylate cyclase [Halopseudomonas phragmitis]|uniref:diguanylate cyclase n=2 Tax=Pseudomonadaceae TaxID=135621 RepID=A0A1V0B228_9GAMM|nr:MULTISPECIES: diguanylate cyclase [Pseudomonadaceae]AQZ93941.1 hypothetical protein BVH74_03875 [Halopseudomonas phragmitis]RHW20525.1 diguanylate cyclase [Pseudomonas jilinensis]